MSEVSEKGNINLFCQAPQDSMKKELSEVSDSVYTLDEAVNKVGFGTFQHKLLFVVGLSWAADAIELTILSLIGTILACDWQIYTWQLAILTTGVFVGMMIGSPVMGMIADKYGRKKCLKFSIILTLLFGAASSASPSYYWLLVLRSCAGVGLSGLPQGLTLCCEYFPTKIRGKAGMYLCYYWSIGTFIMVLMSWVILETARSWRLLLVIGAVPMFIALISLKWMAESVRYCMVSDKSEKAQKIVEMMARVNGRVLPPGRLEIVEKCEERGRLCDLFSPKYRISTFLFCYILAASAFTYYGITFISPFIIASGNIATALAQNGTSNMNTNSIVPCVLLTRQNYIDLLWTSAAEIPGLLFFTILIEKCNRKMFLCGTCVASAIFVFLLLIKTNHKIIILLFLFGARGILVGVYQMAYIIVSESFPTTLRAVAVGLGGTSAKIGGLVNSYVSQILIVIDPVLAICILGVVILIAGIAAVFLPLETRGVVLLDSHIKGKGASVNTS